MENNYQTLNPQENILDDLDVHLVQASGGKRFVNMLIDVIAFYVVIFVLAMISPTMAEIFTNTIVNIVLYGLYFSGLEIIFKGKSLGKVITQTRAVQEDGSPLTPSNAFARGFSRLVPFEAFSALGKPSHPWHDRWSHTYVIDETQSQGVN